MADLRIAIAGLGTVGAGLVKIIAGGEGMRGMAITGVSARDRSRDRGINLEPYTWFDDPVAMASDENVDVFVELVGGDEGPAKKAIEAALHAGKHVVTANKALIAKHGLALAALAEEKSLALRYEAAVAGGVPVVRGLRDGLSGTRVTSLQGVLNGTCNFILAAMETGRTYADALAEAQAIGFAEADPSFDVGGIDAAQKLAILCALSFGAMPTLEALGPQGIDTVTPQDLAAAHQLGLRMKLVASAKRDEQGLSARVGPALVPFTAALDIGGGGENIVVAEAEPLGRVAFSGPGAGGGATASAVAADLVTIGRGSTGPVFARPCETIDPNPEVFADASPVAHFLRVLVEDRPGVLAQLADLLGSEGVSVETIRQSPAGEGEAAVEVVITTHRAVGAALTRAAEKAAALPVVLARPSVYPILKEDQPS